MQIGEAHSTSVLGSRAFLDVLYGNWYNFFPLRPTRDFGLYDGPWGPGREDEGEDSEKYERSPSHSPRPARP